MVIVNISLITSLLGRQTSYALEVGGKVALLKLSAYLPSEYERQENDNSTIWS